MLSFELQVFYSVHAHILGEWQTREQQSLIYFWPKTCEVTRSAPLNTPYLPAVILVSPTRPETELKTQLAGGCERW